MKRWAAVFAAAAVLLGGACSPADHPPAGANVTPASADSAEADLNAQDETTEEDFTFDDIAEFDDGLVVEIAGTVAVKAAAGQTGAERTRGEIVIVSVRLENLTGAELDVDTIVVSCAYGAGLDAPVVTDPTGELQPGFMGVVAPDEEVIAVIGFAVPFTQLDRVVITVDRGDPAFEPVEFRGPVERG